MHTRPLYAVQDFSVPWIQCLAASSQPPLALEPPDPPTSAILRDRNYGVCFAADNVWLFRRGCDHEQGLSSLLYQSPPPEAARPESVAGDARALPELTYSVVASHYPLRSDIHHVHLDLYWRAPASRAGTRFGFGVRLRGRTHWVCYEPAFGLVPSERWRPHAIVRDQLVVHITNPEGAPSATLLVKVDTSDGRRGYVATVRRIVFR